MWSQPKACSYKLQGSGRQVFDVSSERVAATTGYRDEKSGILIV